MLGSSSIFGSSPKRKREENVVEQQQQEQDAGSSASQQVVDSISAGLDEESLQIVEYFEKRDADQQKLIDELTREMEELNLEKSMETFMSKLMGKLVLDESDDKKASAVAAVVDDKRLKQIKRMQADENIVLKVGGRLFYSTIKTLSGEGLILENSSEKQQNDQPADLDKKSDNLFKVMFSSTFSIQYVTTENGIKAINFEDRNPDNFEYILEHLRANGRVKCLGLEELSFEKLTGIQEESQFFLTDKLTNYIDKLLLKKQENLIAESMISVPQSSTAISQSAKSTIDAPIPIKTSLPVEWLEQFKKFDLSNKERMFELIDTTKAQINLTKQQIIDFSNSLRDKLVQFMDGGENNESDLNIKLDVSGTCFNIPFKIFKVHKEFIVYDFILSENFALTSKGTIFIDRNPELFQIIYSYLISGNFNNFPLLTPSNKKRLKHEAQFYRLNKFINEYFDECRYPVETIGTENIKIKEQEDYLRELFVKDRSNPILEDKYLLLAPIFALRHQIDGLAKDKYKIPNCPKLLNFCEASSYSRYVSEPVMVKSLEYFKSSWKFATSGLLEGLDWNNVFAAGGMVLGCLLEGNNAKSYKKFISTRYGNQNDKSKPTLREKQDSDDEEEGFEEPTVAQVTQTIKDTIETPSSSEYMKLPYNYQYSDYQFNQLRNRSTMPTTYQHQQHTSLYGTQSIFGAVQQTPAAFSISSLLSSSTTLPPMTMGMPLAMTMPTATYPMPTLGMTMPTATPPMTIGMPLTMTMPTATPSSSLFGSTVDSPSAPLSTPPTEFQDSDIDLFLYALTPEQAEDKLRHIYQVIKNNSGKDILVVRTQFTVTFYAQKIIQVVLRLYKSPAEILLGFDICAACVGYDGSQVWSNARARRALAQQTNLIDPDRMSTSYEARLYKYARRGFSVSVPGYDPGKIKNHFLMFPRTYRSQHIDVHGLAKILLMDYANKSPKTSYILSEFERNKALEKQIARERLLKYFDKDFKSDYDDIPVYRLSNIFFGNENQGQYLFQRFSRRVELFQKISKIPNWKPYYIFALNDVETIINDTSNSSNLSEKIQWIQINPGSQKIGSFKPVMSNFYSDAYNYATTLQPNKTRKKRVGKQTYTAIWSWEKNISAHTYENYSMLISNKIELAYRKYCDSTSYLTSSTAPTTVPIMDNYHIDFTCMQQINSSDPTRRRKVQRQAPITYTSTFEDVPVRELSSKTYY